jgi:hypothetical protein
VWGSATLQAVQQGQGVSEAQSPPLVLFPVIFQQMDLPQTLR